MIEIRDGRLGTSVFSTQHIPQGTVLLRGWGERVPRRTRHSFQVDIDTHIIIRGPIELINHSCEPNCGVFLPLGKEVMEIHALRDIAPGEELFTDYATFEYEIQHFPGRCLCGKPRCRGRIGGYKDLPPETRDAYGQYIAQYLEEMETVGVLVR